MNIKEEEKREGFHVVDALLKHSPEIIKKIFIPDSRNDQRLSSLVSVAESLSIDVEVNKKTKQHPIAKIIPQPTLGNKDLKKLLSLSYNCLNSGGHIAIFTLATTKNEIPTFLMMKKKLSKSLQRDQKVHKLSLIHI